MNENDRSNGYPGVRGVLTLGSHYAYDPTSLTERLNDSELSAKIAAYHPREFQFNTAFSKAFLADEAGSSAGIEGPYLYIDQELLSMLDAKPYRLHKREENEQLVLEVMLGDKTIAQVYLKSPGIKFKERGFDTIFYQYLNKHTKIDDIFNAASYAESKRYALIDDA